MEKVKEWKKKGNGVILERRSEIIDPGLKTGLKWTSVPNRKREKDGDSRKRGKT